MNMAAPTAAVGGSRCCSTSWFTHACSLQSLGRLCVCVFVCTLQSPGPLACVQRHVHTCVALAVSYARWWRRPPACTHTPTGGWV
jgi:hypothetical protein